MTFKQITHDDRTGTGLMFVAAVAALTLANSPARHWYASLSGVVFGPSSLHLHLSLESWVTDGLLAVFFFVVGLELKHEMVQGSLRSFSTAALPVLAALGGVAVPAAIYLVLSGAFNPAVMHGWAIPTATDIAFVVAVFALVGRGLPSGLRTFLLTLAVADDLIAILIIAIWYSGSLQWIALPVVCVAVIAYAVLARLRRPPLLALVVIGLVAWAALHASGIHATLAGVALGLVTPARSIGQEPVSRAVVWGEHLSVWSSLVVLPIFAFFATGVTLSGGGNMFDSAFWIVSIALFAGKIIGVSGATFLATRTLGLSLPSQVRLMDVVAASPLTAIGFTIALLVASLTFSDPGHLASSTLGILVTSVIAACFGALTLWAWKRKRWHQSAMID